MNVDKERLKFSPDDLTFRKAFYFPLDTPEARRDILVGGLTMISFLLGWILNLGYRLRVVQRFYARQEPYFPGFSPWTTTFKRGLVAFCAILSYLSPSACVASVTYIFSDQLSMSRLICLGLTAVVLFLMAIFALPGGMTVYAVENSTHVLKSPLVALKRAWRRRRAYAKAWLISLVAVAIAHMSLFALILPFPFVSVWSWLVAGYAFTVAMYMKEEA